MVVQQTLVQNLFLYAFFSAYWVLCSEIFSNLYLNQTIISFLCYQIKYIFYLMTIQSVYLAKFSLLQMSFVANDTLFPPFRPDRTEPEVVLLLGPPGSGKSALINTVVRAISGKHYEKALPGRGIAASKTLTLQRWGILKSKVNPFILVSRLCVCLYDLLLLLGVLLVVNIKNHTC